MSKGIKIHEGVIRPSLLAELESFRAPDSLVSSFYLDLNERRWGNAEGVRIALKNALREDRKRIDQLDVGPAIRHALRRDWELVEELAPTFIGEHRTRSLACFVSSEMRDGCAVRIPRPLRHRAFFVDRFVLWPLRLVLDQADRYGVILADKDDARLFQYYLEQIEEFPGVFDTIPGRIRFPDPYRDLVYMHKHIEHFHRHFEKTADAALRQFEREPFEHLIIGGLWETLPQFESFLHRYLRDRIIARWSIDVHTPTPQIQERVQQEEALYLERQAEEAWRKIQDQRPRRGAIGPEQVFAALWERRVEILLVCPDVSRAGFRCLACGRLSLSGGACQECGGQLAHAPDVFDEAVHDAVEQSGHVRHWKNQALKESDCLAALKRF